jgi:hypothetical protein
MIKGFATFLFLSVAIGFATQIVRHMTGQQRWDLTKLLFFSTMCSLAAIVVLMLIVVLF